MVQQAQQVAERAVREAERLTRVLNDRLAREQRVSTHDLRPRLLRASAPVFAAYQRLYKFVDGNPTLSYADISAYLRRNVRAEAQDQFEELLYDLLTEHRNVEREKAEQRERQRPPIGRR